MEISFLHPIYFLLLLIIPLLWFVPHRVSNKVQGILRSLVFLAIIIGLTRPVILNSDAKTYQIFIVDHSASISQQQREQQDSIFKKLLNQVSAKDPVSTIVVGDKESKISAVNSKQFDDELHIAEPSNQSSLSAALQAAAQQIPQGTRGVISLISDGLATDRRWAPVVQTLVERGIPVNTYNLQLNQQDVYPASIKVEPNLRAGQTVRLNVNVIGTASGIVVRLMDGNREIAQSTPVNSQGRVTVPLEFEPDKPGFLTVRVEVVVPEGQDQDDSNNQMTRTLAIQDPISVLYLGERMQQGAARIAELVGNGFKVDDAADRALDENFPLHQYDLVIVDDKPAKQLPANFQQHLIDNVSQKGLGLVFSGGKASFGAGGYYDTALANILPVEFSQRDEKRDPSASLAIILDTSGSMEGVRLDLAKQVARLAIRRLQPHDRVGIVEFYGAKRWAIPMQPAANKIEIDRAIGRLQPTGGTILLPGIEEAYYGLKNIQTRYKHILIITDAGVENVEYETMVRRIVKDGINVSTVLVGDQAHSQIMVDMSIWGKGRFYSVESRHSLPELVLKQSATTKLPAYQTGQFSLTSRGGQGWWDDIDRSSIPSLDAYVESKGKPGAEILLQVEERSHPVLASWHYGLGRVTSMMTEPVGPGTNNWRDWRDYGRMLARVLSRTAADNVPFQYQIKRDDYQVAVIAKRYSKQSSLYPQASLLDDSDNNLQSLNFRELAPGLFRANLIANPNDDIRIKAGVDNSAHLFNTRLVSMANEDVFPEKQVDPLLGLDLTRLSEVTGGNVVQSETPQIAQHNVDTQQTSLTLSKLWPYFLLLALLIYLAELIYRRRPNT